MNLDPETRLSLIARLGDLSDDDAWSEFVQIYQPVIRRFLQKYGLQYADAVEVTQEVLGGVLKSIDSFDGDRKGSTFRGWLYRITRNKAVNLIKDRLRFSEADGNEGVDLNQFADPRNIEPEATYQLEFERHLFFWAAEKIAPTVKSLNWQAFWLTTVEGQTVRQTAKCLEVDESMIYVARCRIMKRMTMLIQSRLDGSSQSDSQEAPR